MLPAMAFAHDGEILFKTELEAIEKLLLGGYARLGLIVTCIIVAIIGAIKQNVTVLLIGLAAALFVFMMKNWITTTFTMVI